MAKSKSTSKIAPTSSALVPAASGGMSKEDRARMKKYQAEDDLRTMQRAQEVCSDKARMNAAKRLAKEQASALTKLAK